MKEVAVYVTGVEPMADMAVDLLREEGVIARKSAYHPELSSYPFDSFGDIIVFVPEFAAPQALEILSARFSGMEDGETDDDLEEEEEMSDEDSEQSERD